MNAPDGPMRVIALWRYPVKSLQGESIGTAEVTRLGFAGDRQYALFDVATGFGLTARRVPQLLFASARVRTDDSVEITLPDGSVAVDDGALSAWLGRQVTLRAADSSSTPRRYENVADFEHEPSSSWQSFDGSAGAFHDSAGACVSLLSQTTIEGWASRRFRANVLLERGPEDALVGSRVQIGSACLDVGMHITRCVMVTRPQPGGIDRDLDVLRRIHRGRNSCLAVGATVHQPGTVRVGDALQPGGHESSRSLS